VNESGSLMSEIYDQRYSLIFVAFWWNFSSNGNNCLETRINTALTYVIFNALQFIQCTVCQSKYFRIQNMKTRACRHNFGNSSVGFFIKAAAYNGRFL